MKLIKDLGMLKPTPKSSYTKRCGLYECPICNKHFKVISYDVKRGHTTKCRACSATSHGDSNSMLYKVWYNMKNRCYNKNTPNYNYYGGRGVTVCDEWKDSYEAFAKWALESGYSDNLTLDKDIKCKELNINPPAYSPTTCCWISPREQRENTRTPRNSLLGRFGEDGLSEIIECYFNSSHTMQSICESINTTTKTFRKMLREYGFESKNSKEYLTSDVGYLVSFKKVDE